MAATHARPGPKTEKPWRHAIQQAVKELIEVEIDGKPKKIRALRLLARKMVQKGLNGDVTALKEIGDRLDGKPVQGIDLDVAVKITRIERQIVEPQALESRVIDAQVIEGVAVALSEGAATPETIDNNGETISRAKE